MPVPTVIGDLSTTAASNYPAGSDSPAMLDDVQRAHASFIAQLRDNRALFGANSDITSLSAITSINAGPMGGLRSRFTNGGMAIDQRNNGSAQTFTAAAALAYCVDCWYGYCTGANVTGQRVSGSGNTRYRYQFTGAASVTKIGFAQRIQVADCYDLNNRAVMLGVDLANSLLTTVTWTAWYANTEDTFGTLASPTRTQISTGTITVTSTPTRYYVPISIPAAAATGIEVEFSVAAQTSGTWSIGEAQLVAGAASELWREIRPEGLELALCYRRVQPVDFGIVGIAGSSTALNVSFKTIPPMRAAPSITPMAGTVSFYGASAFSSTTSPTVGGATVNGGFLTWTGFTGLTGGNAYFMNTPPSTLPLLVADL